MERWLLAGLLTGLLGVAVFVGVLVRWWMEGRGALLAIRACTLGLTGVLTGGMTIMNALMLSMLELRMEQRSVQAMNGAPPVPRPLASAGDPRSTL